MRRSYCDSRASCYNFGQNINEDIALNATKARENGATSGVGVLATYGYDDLRRRTSVTLGNGAAQAYSYDAVSRLASLTNDLSGTANDLSVTFAYNPASQIVTETRSNDAYSFTGNANTNTTTVTNGLNELVTVGGVAAAYDGDGDLTTDPTTGKTYAYDSENKLKTASGGVSVYYDPVGRIAEYDTNASSRFMSDGSEVIVQLDGSSNITGRFVRGDGPDELIAWYTSSDPASRNFAHLDQRNSVIAVTSPNGAVTVVNRYDEYGTPQNGNYGPFQYTGQMWLGETAMYYYKARNYLPSSGVFAQTDPIRFAGGVNFYAYTGNDPVNGIDPTGLVNPIVVTGQRLTCSDVCLAIDSILIAAWFSGTGVADSGLVFGTPAILQPGPFNDPAVTCNAGSCDTGVTIHARRHPGASPWWFNGTRFVLDQHYREPWWSPYVDYGFLGLATAPVALIGGVEVGSTFVTVDSASAGYANFGNGMKWQVRFFEKAAKVRYDVNKPVCHVNIEVGPFNFHISPW